MDKKKELAKNTIIIAIGKICTQFVSFLLLPLYTTLLLPEEYGLVDLFNTYIALLVPIFNWQFETGMFRFMIDYREDENNKKVLFSTVISTNAIQCVIYILFYIIAQNFITLEFKIFLAIDVVLNIFLNTMLQFPRGLGDNKTYSMGSFISASSIVVLNVIFIAGLNMHALGMFLATVIGKIISVLYLICATKAWKYFSIKYFKFKMLKRVLKYSLPLVPNQLSWWVIGVSDRTIISNFINIAANGIYSVANKFSGIFITLYNIFNLSWTESISLHLKDKDNETFLKETMNDIFSLFSTICFGIICVIPFIFPVLIGDEYSSAYVQIPILMIAALFQVIVGLYSVFYVALKKSTEIAKTSFYAAVINIVVDILLIKKIGIFAASVSTFIAFFTMAIFRYFHVKKYVKVPLKKKNVLFTTIIGIVVIALYYYNHLITNIISLIGVVIFGIAINRGFLTSIIKSIKNKIVFLYSKKIIKNEEKD